MFNRLVSTLSPTEWIINNRNGQCTLINNITQQQYAPYIMPVLHSYYSSHANLNSVSIQPISLSPHEAQLLSYKNRQLDHIPNTPKIKLVSISPSPLSSPSNAHLPSMSPLSQISSTSSFHSHPFQHPQNFILVQIPQFSFNKFLQKYEKQIKIIYQVTLKIITTMQMLMKKYGKFLITEKMIGILKGFGVVVWVNEDFGGNFVQFPIKGESQGDRRREEEMVKGFERVMRKYGDFGIWNHICQNDNIGFQDIKRFLIKQLRPYSYSALQSPRQKPKTSFSKIPQFLFSFRSPPKESNANRPKTDRLSKQKQSQNWKPKTNPNTSTNINASTNTNTTGLTSTEFRNQMLSMSTNPDIANFMEKLGKQEKERERQVIYERNGKTSLKMYARSDKSKNKDKNKHKDSEDKIYGCCYLQHTQIDKQVCNTTSNEKKQSQIGISFGIFDQGWDKGLESQLNNLLEK